MMGLDRPSFKTKRSACKKKNKRASQEYFAFILLKPHCPVLESQLCES